MPAFLAIAAAQSEDPHYRAGGLLSNPPQQQRRWTPPQSSLPEAFVTATARLFEQGLADPRGCEYREVEVIVGSPVQSSRTVKIHAWVLPADRKSTQRFAVAWDGVVYPVISVGAETDVRQDVNAAINAEQATRDDQSTRPSRPVLSVSQESLSPLMFSLLLRLGEANLAESVWSAWSARMSAREKASLTDPYLMLARYWVGALFDRAVSAHVRGDDRLALLSARDLVRIQETVDKEAAKRGFGPTYFDRSFLNFLEPLPILLADQERRAREGSQGSKVAPLPFGGEKAARIAAYIQSLDQTRIEELPNDVDQTLKQLGGDLIDALLTVIESDPRLTRSYNATGSHPHIVGVQEIAYKDLVALLGISKFELDADPQMQSMLGRRALAAAIRSDLKRYVLLGSAEQWYRLLADDSAKQDQWVEAARQIAKPLSHDEATRVGLPTGGLLGEPLRQKMAPSVSQLLLQRMDAMPNMNEPDEAARLRSLGATVSLAGALAAWDGGHYVDRLRQLSEKLRALYVADDTPNHSGRAAYQGLMLRLYYKRAAIPDSGALREYADWLLTVNPGETGYYYQAVLLFQPAWTHTDDPAVIAAIDRLFGDPKSPWVPIITKYPGEEPKYPRLRAGGAELLSTPLLGFDAFRGQLLNALADRSVVGTLTPAPQGDRYSVQIENAIFATGFGAVIVVLDPKDAQPPPKPLQPVKLRICDVYASRLLGIEEAPQFKAYWSEAQRDAAIEKFAAFLRDHKGPYVDRWTTGREP